MAIPPFAVHPIGVGTIVGRLTCMACMLALVLLGVAFSGHSHAVELSSPQAAIAPNDGGDHCPGLPHPCIPGQCHASPHTHACCILLTATRPDAAVTTRMWGRLREPRLAELVIAPIPRPPASLVA